MRRFRFWPQMALVLALAVMNGGCVLIPELKDRIVELAVGGTTVAEFTTSGDLNTLDDAGDVNVLADFDLAEILDDAGVDVSDVTSIKFTGVDYRVTVPDPQSDRLITNGNVTVAREGRGPFPLVSGFEATAGAVTDWQAGPIDPGGQAVTEINDLLSDILTALQAGTLGTLPGSVTTVSYHVTGDSTPGNVGTNFTYQLKLKVTITGTVKVKVPA